MALKYNELITKGLGTGSPLKGDIYKDLQRLLENDANLSVEVGNMLNRVEIMIKDSSVQPDAALKVNSMLHAPEGFTEGTKTIVPAGRHGKPPSYTAWSNLNCGGNCSGTCSNTCSGTCFSACVGCTGSCSVACVGTCTGSCTGSCTGLCTGACTSCSRAGASSGGWTGGSCGSCTGN